jgi:predicted nucleic acid-binding protein
MGSALFCEFEDVMGRPELFKDVPVSAAERAELVASFMNRARWTRVSYGWRPNLPDESDNHIVELAVAGNAEAVVTNNVRDFRRGDLAFPQLRILTPRQLMEDL